MTPWPDLLMLAGLAFVVALTATPLAAMVARRIDVMDHPDRKLKPHARPIPYLGGLAILAGWLAAIAFAWWRFDGLGLGRVIALSAGGTAMLLLGLADDAREVRPKVRLALGALIVATVVALTGAEQGVMSAFRDLTNGQFIGTPARILAIPVAMFVVLSACNSTNLIDGLDGLAAGVSALIGLAFAVLAAIAATGGLAFDPLLSVLAAATCGSALGFLFWNFNPARIFMGDAGSILLGYSSGLMILLLGQAGLAWLAAGLVIFALPTYDTALAIGRRWWNRKPIFIGDRSHFYDQLRDRGLSVRATVMICYLLALVYGIFGLAPLVFATHWTLVLYVGLAAATIALTFAAGMVRVDRE